MDNLLDDQIDSAYYNSLNGFLIMCCIMASYFFMVLDYNSLDPCFNCFDRRLMGPVDLASFVDGIVDGHAFCFGLNYFLLKACSFALFVSLRSVLNGFTPKESSVVLCSYF